MKQKRLEDLIIKYNQKYREGDSVITDIEYDSLVRELSNKYPGSRLLKNGIISISQKTLRKVKLPITMRSLDNLKSLEDIKNWIKSIGSSERTAVTITPKYDGISILMDGETKEAYTSGDGTEGQISTEHMRHIPKMGMSHYTGYSIGEAIIPKRSWDNYFKGKNNEVSGKPFKSPRNTIAGLFNNDEVDPIIRYLKKAVYIPYTYFTKNGIQQYIDKSEMVEHIPHHKTTVSKLTVGILNNLYKEYSELFEIDGLVIDVESYQRRMKLGYEKNGNPQYAKAIKLPQWQGVYETTVESIETSVSRNGLIKPVICIKPVSTGNATISRVTGINMKFINDWHILQGTRVSIIRSGEVIPRLYSVEGTKIPFKEEFESNKSYEEEYNSALVNLKTKNKEIFNIKKCPSCNGNLKWDKNKVELVCNNEYCSTKVIKQLEHFLVTIGIEGIAETSCKHIYDYVSKKKKNLTLNYILEWLFRSTLTIRDLLRVETFGWENTNNLYSQLNYVKTTGVKAEKLFDALGVFDNMGEKKIKNILDGMNIHSIEELNNIKNRIDELNSIRGVAENSAKSFIDGVEKLKDLVLPVEPIFSKTKQNSGIEICCTGFRFSNEEAGYLISRGYKPTDNLSKSTNLLVVKDITKKSNKLKKAEKQGTKIINRSEIFRL